MNALPSSHQAGSQLGCAAGAHRHIQFGWRGQIQRDKADYAQSQARQSQGKQRRWVPNPGTKRIGSTVPVSGLLVAPCCADSIFIGLISLPYPLSVFNYYVYLSCPTRTCTFCFSGTAAAGQAQEDDAAQLAGSRCDEHCCTVHRGGVRQRLWAERRCPGLVFITQCLMEHPSPPTLWGETPEL